MTNFKYYFKVKWWNWFLGFPFISSPYFFMRRLIEGVPTRNVSDARFETAKRYRDTYEKYGNGKLEEAVCFEFGAGREMLISMCLGVWGVKRIYSYDLTRHIRPELLNLTASRIKEKIGYPEDSQPKLMNLKNFQQVLLEDYHIDYRAPADASTTTLTDCSIDFVYANAVLEHVPWESLNSILKECHRLLKPDGIIAFEVDYRDHARDGKSISPYHFLRFSHNEWKNYTHCDGGHNRKRHKDYKELFKNTGFDIVREDPVSPLDESFVSEYAYPYKEVMGSQKKTAEELRQSPIAADFNEYTLEELAVLAGFWILKKSRSM